MAIITISRGAYSHGRDIAEKVAQRLRYACISRELLLETSEQFNIPEISLTKALEDAPSVLEKFVHGKEKYIAFIEATLLEHARKENIVYHGLAGHLFLSGIKHVLNVRIIADTEDRARLVMERDRVSRDEALRFLKKVDGERKRWGLALYGVDVTDPGQYHILIHVNQITLDDAADIICHTAGLERFKATPESLMALDDRALAAKAKAKLVPVIPDVMVTAHKGTVLVKAKTNVEAEHHVVGEIREIVQEIPGVADVKIEIELTTLRFL
jgi:cytidylate kinase